MPFRGGTRHQPTAGRTRGDAASLGSGSSTTGIARGMNTAGQITGDTGNSCIHRVRGDHGEQRNQRRGLRGPEGNSCIHRSRGITGTAVPAGTHGSGDHGGTGETAVPTGAGGSREQPYQRGAQEPGGHGIRLYPRVRGSRRTAVSAGDSWVRGHGDLGITEGSQHRWTQYGRGNGDRSTTGALRTGAVPRGIAAPAGIAVATGDRSSNGGS